MTTPKRKRDVQLNFRVSPEELAMIEQKMAQLGTKNRDLTTSWGKSAPAIRVVLRLAQTVSTISSTISSRSSR